MLKKKRVGYCFKWVTVLKGVVRLTFHIKFENNYNFKLAQEQVQMIKKFKI